MLRFDEAAFLSGGEDIPVGPAMELPSPKTRRRSEPLGISENAATLAPTKAKRKLGRPRKLALSGISSDNDVVGRRSPLQPIAPRTVIRLQPSESTSSRHRNSIGKNGKGTSPLKSTMTPLRLSYKLPVKKAQRDRLLRMDPQNASQSSPAYPLVRHEEPHVYFVSSPAPTPSQSVTGKTSATESASSAKENATEPVKPAYEELDEQELLRRRFESQRRLALTFEQLFAKYSVSFEGETDVIDLGTMQVVEDNGFLRKMSGVQEFGGVSEEEEEGGEEHVVPEKEGSQVDDDDGVEDFEDYRSDASTTENLNERQCEKKLTKDSLEFESGEEDGFDPDALDELDFCSILRKRKTELLAARDRLKAEDEERLRPLVIKVDDDVPTTMDPAFLSGGEEVGSGAPLAAGNVVSRREDLGLFSGGEEPFVPVAKEVQEEDQCDEEASDGWETDSHDEALLPDDQTIGLGFEQESPSYSDPKLPAIPTLPSVTAMNTTTLLCHIPPTKSLGILPSAIRMPSAKAIATLLQKTSRTAAASHRNATTSEDASLPTAIPEFRRKRTLSCTENDEIALIWGSDAISDDDADDESPLKSIKEASRKKRLHLVPCNSDPNQ